MINLVENYDNEDKVCKVNLRKKKYCDLFLSVPKNITSDIAKGILLAIFIIFYL